MYLLPAAGAYTSGRGWEHLSLWSMPGKSANVFKAGRLNCALWCERVESGRSVPRCNTMPAPPTTTSCDEGEINELSSEMWQSHLAVPNHTRTDVRGPVPYFSFQRGARSNERTASQTWRSPQAALQAQAVPVGTLAQDLEKIYVDRSVCTSSGYHSRVPRWTDSRKSSRLVRNGQSPECEVTDR